MMGVVNTIEYAAMNAFQQLKVPQDKLGRVMSINFAVSSLPSILGLVLVGALTEAVGWVGVMFSLCGVILLIVGIVQYFTPAIQQTIREDNAKWWEQ